MRGRNNYLVLMLIAFMLLFMTSFVSAEYESEYQLFSCEEGYYPVYQNWNEDLGVGCDRNDPETYDADCYVECRRLKEGECYSSLQCDDGDECTQDYCVGCSSGTCIEEDVPAPEISDPLANTLSSTGYCRNEPKCESGQVCDSDTGICKERCVSPEIRTFSCEGIYKTTVDNGVCTGRTWIEQNCDTDYTAEDGDHIVNSFLSLIGSITGRVADVIISDDGECIQEWRDCNTVSDTEVSCLKRTGCTWLPDVTTTTHNCSTLSEYACDRNSQCTTKITCEDPEVIVPKTPTLKWMDELEMTEYSTSLDSPMSGPVRMVLKLVAENPSESNNFTLVGKEAGSTFSKTIVGYRDNGVSKANWMISLEDLNAIGDANNDGTYEVAFKYDGEESQVLYYERRLSHCENGIIDEDETDIDCGGVTCTVCPPKDPVLKWTDSTGAQILSQLTWDNGDQTINVKMVVENPATELKTFEIKEASEVVVKSNIPAEISENKWTYLWTITADDLKAANEADGDNNYTFTFEADSKVSPELSLTVNFDVFSCGNGICDAGEDASTCSSDCFIAGDGICENGENGQADKGETCENSISDCVCTGPMAFWAATTTVPYEFDVNDLSGHEFRMVLANPSAAPGKFTLKESDSPLSDDEIKTFTGEKNEAGTMYGYNWSTSYSDFWAANSESDNIYEFYFDVEGQTSKQLLIKVINGDIPTCNDGILNGDEERVDCGGECDECQPAFCKDTRICGDYKDADSCNADAVTCKVADASTGALSADQKALCFWENNKCNVKKATIGVGDCNYVEDYGEDTCDEDGFLSYSYKAEFIWSPNNKYGVEVASNADYIYDAKASTEEGTPIYRYDQNRESLKCQDGTRTVQCPAQIQLSFFSWLNLIVAAFLIIIIYLILADKKKSTKKKTVKKKVVSKKKPSVKKVAKKKVVSKKKTVTKKKK